MTNMTGDQLVCFKKTLHKGSTAAPQAWKGVKKPQDNLTLTQTDIVV